MVAIIGGSGLGLSESSLAALGSRGVSYGAAGQGRNGERAFVNVASGNLVLQDLDGLLVGLGPDVASVRTYNSQGQVDFTNQDGWWEPQYKAVVRVDTTTLKRTESDGSTATYVWNATSQRYVESYSPGEAVSTICVNGDGSFTWTDGSTGCTEKYAGSGRGFIQSSTDASKANICTYTYTGNLLTQVKTSDGETVTYGYQGNNLVSLSTTILSGGVQKKLNQISYTYDSQNRLSTVAVQLNPDGQVPSGSETLTTYTTTYTYDGSSTRVASITQSDGSSQSFTYVQVNGGYRIASVKDGAGKVTQFAYDTANSKTTVTDPLGVSTVYQYDATSGQLTQIRMGVTASNANGLTQVSYAYNGLGDVTSLTDGQGRTVTMTYDTSGNLLRQVDAAGDTHEWTYTTDNQVQTETVYAAPAAGTTAASVPQVTRYIYAASNGYQLRFVIGADGAVTEHRYNAQGLRTSTLSHGARYDVSGLAQNAAPTEASMTTWAAAQNAALCQRTDFTYDFRGQLQTQTTHASGLTAYSITQGTNPPTPMTDSTTQYVYDQRGNLLQTITPDTRDVTQMIYDGLGRIVSAVEKGDGAVASTTVYQYDDANGKTSVTQTNGLTTTSAYDKTGRLVSVTQLSGSTTLGSTTYAYDADGHLLMTMDASGLRTWMLYDAAGQKVADIDGTGAVTEYVYNAAGQITQSIHYFTKLASTVLASLVDANGNPKTAYGAGITLAGIRPKASTLDVKSWNLYDSAGRLSLQVNGVGDVIQTQYDGASRVVSVTRYATAITASTLGNGVGVLPSSVTLTASADDRTTTSIYSDEGLLRGVVDGEGYLTEYQYNSHGQQVQSIAYKAARFTDVASLATLMATCRSNGPATALVATSDPDALRTITYHNERGQVSAQLNAAGYLTEMVYDASGHLCQTIRYATGTQVPTDTTVSATLASLRPAPAAEDQVTTNSYDALGRLSKQTNPEGTVTQYTYDSLGRVISTVTALNTSDQRTLLAQYDVQGRLVAELSGEGAAKLTGNQTQDQINAIWNQYGIRYTYDAVGRRISQTDGLGQRTVYFYDNAGRLTHTVNAAGEVSETTYNALGHVAATTQYGGRIAGNSSAGLTGGLLSATVNKAAASALATAKTAGSATNDVTQYTYDTAGRLYKTTDVLGGTTTLLLNAFGETLKTTQTVSRVTGKIQNLIVSNTYDRRGLVTKVIQGVDGVNIFSYKTYDAFGRMTGSQEGTRTATAISYDKLGRVVTVKDPLSNSQSTSYDAFNRVLTQTDAWLKTTSYAYNTANRSVKMTTPEGVSTTTVHTRAGQTLSVTDGNQKVTTYTYDADGHLTDAKQTVTGADGTQTVLESTSHFDALKRLDWTEDANKNHVAYTYDAANRVLSRTLTVPGDKDQVTRYSYTAKGQVLTVTDPAGIVTTYAYDAKGQVLTQTVDQSGTNLVTTYTYNDTGHVLTVVTSANGVAGTTTQYTYDALGRRTSTILDPSGLALTTTYTYDTFGNVVAVKDAQGNVTRSVYDSDNHLILTVDAFGNVVRTAYDKDGRAITVTRYSKAIDLTGLASNVVLTDATVTSKLKTAASVGTVVENRVYDKDGRLTYTVGATGTVTKLEYDGDGNVVQQTTYAGTLTNRTSLNGVTVPNVASSATDHVVRYSYDEAGRRISVTVDPSGLNLRTVTTYDADGNVVAVTDAQGNVSRNVYDAASRLIWSVDAVGCVVHTDYDQDNRVIAVTRYTKSIALTGLSLKASASDIQTKVNAVVGQSSTAENRVYDTAGRLNFTVDATGTVTKLVYDSKGNVTQQTVYAQPLTNRSSMNGVTPPAVTDSDPNNRVTKYGYDAANRLISVTDARGTVTTLDYFQNGKVVRQTVADQVTWKGYDADNRLSWTVDGAGSVTKLDYDGSGNVVLQTQYAGTLASGTDLTGVLAPPVPAAGPSPDHVTQYVYDAAGRCTDVIVDPGVMKLTTHTTYDLFGNAVAVKDANLNTSYYVYDKANRLVMTVNQAGGVVRTDYDACGRVIAMTRYTQAIDPTSVSTTSTLSAITSKATAVAGQSTVVENRVYDADGRLTFTVDGLGAVTQNTYDGRGNLISQLKSANALTNRASLDGKTAPVVQGSAADRLTQYGYDADNRLTFAVDALGAVTRNVYDALGNLTKQIKYGSLLANRATWDGATAPTTDPTADPDRVTLMSYDLLGRLTYVVDAAGDVTQNVYDVHGNVIAQVAYQSAVAAPTASSTFPTNLPSTPGAGDRVTLTAYDGANRKLYSVDGGGYVTAYVYDGLGQLSSSTLYMKAVSGLSVGATASTITAQITAQSIAQSSVDETTRFAYDAAGRLTSSTDACGKTESYVYDAMGNKIQFTNKTRSAVWTYAYDQVGRLTKEIDPAVNVTTMSADATTGVMTTNPLGNRQIVTQLVYDALGNLVSRTEGGLLNADQSIDLSKSRTTSYAYDALGHQITITYPSAGVYNVADLANLNTDGAGASARTEIPSPTLTTQVVYDLFGEAVANIDTGRNVSTKTYNNLGQVDYEVDAMGYVTYYGRNVFGDVTTLTHYSITTTVNPSASSLTPTTAVGAGIPSSSQVKAALVAANDTASRTITTLYDQLGRACQVTQPTTWVNPSGTNATGYLQAAITKTSYNAFGEVFQTKVLASGTATTPTWAITTNYYDQRGHLTGTVIPVDLATQTYYVTTQTYDAAGNLSGRTEYANALTSWAPPTSSTASLTLPTADLLNDRTTQYTYDQCNRKTSEKIVHVDFSVYNPTSHGVTGASSDATTSYTYDAVGNQISTQDAGSNVTYTYYDALGRITAVAAPSRDITFGGITSAGVPLTVFKRDNYGNVTVKTEYAKGAAGDPLNGYTANPDTSASSKDRTTLTQYDLRGNAIQTQDPNGVKHFMSYDALGRLAKVWQGVTRYTPTDAELNGPMLRLGQELGGTILYSSDLHYQLVVESDHLIILDRISGATLWTSNTSSGTTSPSRVRLVLQTDGDLVLSSTTGGKDSTTTILWRSGTAGKGGTTLKMGTDGNLALYNASGVKVWGTTVSAGSSTSEDTPGFVTHTFYTVFQYDALGRQTDIITPASTNVLNDKGILLSKSQATVGSITTHMNYNAFGEMTDRGNCATGTTVTYQESFRYDAAGRLWYTNSGDGTEKIFLYDLLGNQTAQISSSGLGTTDGKGLDISSATLDSLNQQVMLGSNNIDAQGDANLRRTSYQRDLLGRVLHQVLPSRMNSSGTASFKPVIDQTFDRWGNVLTQTLPHDPTVMVGATTYVYNKYNQVIQQTQPEVAYGADGALRGNPTTLMYYDILGRQVAIRDANGNVNGQVWGGGGQLAQEIHADADATGGTITHYYDAFGDQVRLVDAENHVITYAYDNLGHNTTITHPNMSVAGYSTPQDITTTMTYDEVGNKVTVTDGTGAVIKYAYDLRGNMIRSTDQDGYTSRRAFDAQGRKTAEQDANLNVSTWSYDYFGQLISRTAVDSRARYAYGSAAVVSTQTFTYDNARQLQTQTSTSTDGSYPSGQNLAYTYDAAGQLIRIADAAGGQTTTYTYNALGQHVTETVTQTSLPAAITTLNSSLDSSHQIAIGAVYQNQYLTYDTLGRLATAQAWKADGTTVDVGVAYTYDLVGNKYEEKTQSWTEYIPATGGTPGHYTKDGIWIPGTPGTPAVPSTLATKTLDYAYDSMNRQIVVDSSSHDASTFHDGHLLAYDHNGNRIKDTFLGTQVACYNPPGPPDKSGGPTYSSHTGTVTQDYHYDAMDRLTTVVLENPLALSGMVGDFVDAVPGTTNPTTLTLDTRQYDGASRVVSSGPHGSINRSYLSILLSGNTNLSGATSTTTTYDHAGRMLTQSVSNETDSSQNYTLKYSGTSNVWSSVYLGYDGTGNVQESEMLQGSVTNHYLMTSCFTLSGYQEQVISSTIISPGSSPYASNVSYASTKEYYDANGFLNRMTQTADSSGLYDTRVFVNNASGMALWKYENGNVLKQLIINGEVLGIYGKGADPNAVTPPAPGTAPAMVTQSNFNLAYTPVSNAYPSPTAGMYTVQVGDSLQGIALSAYGDSSLWYLIADANGLSGDSDLHYGQILTIPTNVGSVHNSADTHTPYDPSKIIGSTNPSTALPAPSADSGCGGIGQFIMIVVAVVVAIVVTIYCPPASGGVWPIVDAMIAGAAGAAAGSIASQCVGIAIGAQDEFSWDQVGKAAIGGAISGGVGAGLGPAINTGSAFVDAAAKAAISNAMTQGAEMMLGMQKSFNWMSVATSAVGAGVGAEANKYLSNNTTFQKAVGSELVDGKLVSQTFGGKLVQGTLSGFASGMASSIVHGGRIDVAQIATDAFGNALGSSLADKIKDAQIESELKALLDTPVPTTQAPTTQAPTAVAMELPWSEADMARRKAGNAEFNKNLAILDQMEQDSQKVFDGFKNLRYGFNASEYGGSVERFVRSYLPEGEDINNEIGRVIELGKFKNLREIPADAVFTRPNASDPAATWGKGIYAEDIQIGQQREEKAFQADREQANRKYEEDERNGTAVSHVIGLGIGKQDNVSDSIGKMLNEIMSRPSNSQENDWSDPGEWGRNVLRSLIGKERMAAWDSWFITPIVDTTKPATIDLTNGTISPQYYNRLGTLQNVQTLTNNCVFAINGAYANSLSYSGPGPEMVNGAPLAPYAGYTMPQPIGAPSTGYTYTAPFGSWNGTNAQMTYSTYIPGDLFNPRVVDYSSLTSPVQLLSNGQMDFRGIQGWAQAKGLQDIFRPSATIPDGGFKFSWSDDAYDYVVWGHGYNNTAPRDSYSYSSPTVSISRQSSQGLEYLWTDGNWNFRGPRPTAEQHIPLTNSPYPKRH